MLSVRAVGAVMTWFVLDRVIATALAAARAAGVPVTERSLRVEVPALRELVFNFIEFIHFLSVLVGGKLAERIATNFPGGVCRVLGNAALGPGSLLARAVGGFTALACPSLELPSHTCEMSILGLLMLTLKLLAEPRLDFGVEGANTCANVLELLQMEPVGHSVAGFDGGRENVLEAGRPQTHLVLSSALDNLKHLGRQVLEVQAQGGSVLDFVRKLRARFQESDVVVTLLVSKAGLQRFDQRRRRNFLPLLPSKAEVLADERGHVAGDQILEGDAGVLAVNLPKLLELTVEAGEGLQVVATLGGVPERPEVRFGSHEAIIAASP